ncbi:MAG: hypothetical protein GY702_20195 [Desulfobulbaceae bacterium]|nr:hypothetical protein [Desulfobulbaceae bacterium]
MNSKTPIIPLFSLIFILVSSTVYGHKIRIFAWEEGDTIHTESKFSGGRVAQKAAVTVIDKESGALVISGTTDKDGLFSFSLTNPEALKNNPGNSLEIIVDSGDGHKNSWLYHITDQAQAAPTPVVTKPTTKEKPLPQPGPPGQATLSITGEELTLLIEEALDKKLSPIHRTLAENSEQGPNIQDILGGIGYILGLAGIAAYMKSKTKKE